MVPERDRAREGDAALVGMSDLAHRRLQKNAHRPMTR
jgi:hypothetical protein